MKSKIRVACILPIADDPTSWYRGLGPLTRLAQEHPQIELTFPQQISWATLLNADVLFLQRPATPDHFNALVLAKDLGLKVIVDMDDDNLAVPKDNPTFFQYNQMPIKESILKLARHCDVLMVTTPHMKRKYGIYNKNTVIVPNALDDKLLHLRQLPPGAREKKFMWRGTQSHQRNLASVGQPLINLSQKYPDWKFTFFGVDPIDITDRIKNHEVIYQVNITDFYKVLCHVHATALYYPLNSNDHSQARSHISWLEGTFGNMVVLSYKNEEFTRPGLLNYTSLVEFETVMEQIARNEIDVDKQVEESWACIQENYLLSHVNKQRLQIIESLVS